MGPSRARLRLPACAPLRRLARRIRVGAASQSELRAGAGLLRAVAVLQRPLAGGQRGRAPRDPYSSAYWGIAAYIQFVGRNYEEAIKLAQESIRQPGNFVGGNRVLLAA